MNDRIQSIWTRIKHVLNEHAPDAAATLAAPVDDLQIRELENTIRMTIPDDLRASLQVHNGQEDSSRCHDFCGEGIFLSTSEIASTWKMLTGLNEGVSNEWWKLQWIPFAQSDGGAVCIDTIGSSVSQPGEIVAFIHDSPHEPKIAPSYAVWLENLAVRLENGDFEIDEYGYLSLNP